jgi:hypothetical protein
VANGLMAGALFGAAPAGAATDLCVAANGAVRAQKGSPLTLCEASGTGSVAIAKGAGRSATATGGDHNKARVFAGGDNNTVTATSDA